LNTGRLVFLADPDDGCRRRAGGFQGRYNGEVRLSKELNLLIN
jgi:hypothetical protein